MPRTCWHERASTPALLFVDQGNGYAEWCHIANGSAGREPAHRAISNAVARRTAASPWPRWWADTVEPMLRLLPDNGILIGQRQQLVEDFTAHMVPAGMERFAAAGMAATWWEETFHELQTAANRGWKAVIDAWLTTAEASKNDKKAPNLAGQTAIKLLAAPQLAQRTKLEAEHARLDAEIKTAEASKNEDDEPNDDALSPAEIRKLKSARSKAKKQIKAIDASLLATARQTLDAMAPTDAPTQILGVLRSRIENLVTDHYANIERSTLAWYYNLVNKFSITLRELEAERDMAAERLDQHLKELGYE